jgi:hypothetical protein
VIRSDRIGWGGGGKPRAGTRDNSDGRKCVNLRGIITAGQGTRSQPVLKWPMTTLLVAPLYIEKKKCESSHQQKKKQEETRQKRKTHDDDFDFGGVGFPTICASNKHTNPSIAYPPGGATSPAWFTPSLVFFKIPDMYVTVVR